MPDSSERQLAVQRRLLIISAVIGTVVAAVATRAIFGDKRTLAAMAAWAIVTAAVTVSVGVAMLVIRQRSKGSSD